ncbi:MAG TPA: MFS transporter [Candidatus Eisenbergiella intestinipullorum]|nr:MFS transporter [Candidatus Eisenbergiella intestinipullorum]
MATLLLLIIYIAFIGLGVPDSLFGAAWPAIYTEFGIPVSRGSLITMLISGGTILSSLLSAELIRRFGTGRITAFSTSLTAAALFGFSCSGNLLLLCLFAVPLGLGAGAIDTALNNYVALHYRASHMNFLHCFYGIGVSLSPLLMSLALSEGSWRSGYRTAFRLQAGIALLTILTLPFWKKVSAASGQEEEAAEAVGFFRLLKDSRVRMACLVFVGSCGLEYTCGNWGSTFLVTSKGLEADAGAGMITLYYVGIAAGRFLSGILSFRLGSRRLVLMGQAVVLAALLLLCLPGLALPGLGLFLVGLGNGPVFPNMLHLTPRIFGKELSQSVMGVQMAASYVGILLAPALFGVIAQEMGAALFPGWLFFLYLLMMAGSCFTVLKRKKK